MKLVTAYFAPDASLSSVTLQVASAHFLLSSSSLILQTKLPERRSEYYCGFHLEISLRVFVGCCVHIRQHTLTSLVYSA